MPARLEQRSDAEHLGWGRHFLVTPAQPMAGECPQQGDQRARHDSSSSHDGNLLS
jgi:hypothetical protein